MRIILILALCSPGALGQQRQRTNVSASKKEDLAGIEQRYFKDVECIKRFDEILKDKWDQELKKISIDDLGEVKPERNSRTPSKTSMYNTIEQEWLLEAESTSRSIEVCVRGIVSEIVTQLNQEDIDCLNAVFAGHIEEEIRNENKFKKYIVNMSKEQLPFRRFLSFNELAEVLFQDRNPNALLDIELGLYDHAFSYLSTEQDEDDQIFVWEQECPWKNARALREAPNENARYTEFVRQIQESVNQQLGSKIVRNLDLNLTFSEDTFTTWQKTRGEMMPRINEEVAKLRAQKKDAQWLCEYATKLAWQFSKREASILMKREYYSSTVWTRLEVLNVAERARGIEKALEKNRDFRYSVLRNLADKFENGTLCLTAFLHLIESHQRFRMAKFFVNESYGYPELYCKFESNGFGLISTSICKCKGSFCIEHGLSVIYAQGYVLEKGPDGIYRVVVSGLEGKAEERD